MVVNYFMRDLIKAMVKQSLCNVGNAIYLNTARETNFVSVLTRKKLSSLCPQIVHVHAGAEMC